ncbi:MAG: tetratricopeptide repeat protein [Planctomycetota bacterium]
MAFIGKGNKGVSGKEGNGDASSGAGEPDPGKASKFFEHARTTQDTGNNDYAMQLWLRGMGFSPHDMNALESFCSAALSFTAQNGKKGPSKETAQAASGAAGPIAKYLSTLLTWALKPADTGNAVKAAEAAAGAELPEPAYWLGERALHALQADAKPKKDHAVKLMKAMQELGAFDLATKAGEAAVRLDPGDGKLAQEVRNMSAEATLSQGGFEDRGQGGFRKNIRNADKQRELADEDSISKSADTIERLVEKAKADLESRPDDIPAAKTYIKRLLERGTPDDEKLAYNVAMKAFKKHGQFSFRQQAGDIQMRVARRQLVSIRTKAEAGDEKAKATLPQAEEKFRQLEMQEFAARVEAFPTEAGPKYELGRRHFDAGDYQKAIPLLQKSQGDGKYKARSLAMLGESFGKIGMIDPAIDTLRQALSSHSDDRDETGLKLRYALMDALSKKAEAENDGEAAAEAEKIASGIAMQQFDYRDIQARYDTAKQLVKRLRGQ